MKAFVIYVSTSDKSVKSANRTQTIFKNNLNIDVSLFKGINTDNVWQTFIDSNFNILDVKRFGAGSIDAEIATFFSHYNLWIKCLQLDTPILILEHDAILNNTKIDSSILENFKGDLLNLGEPNWGSFYYGNFKSEWLSKQSGVRKREICKNEHDTYQIWNTADGLCHCDTLWLFGAHSYLLNPSGAIKLVEATKNGILPADVYIRNGLLDIYDYLPHPVKQLEEFTLIQRWEK
tara:strand:- start:1231 stop:1932 length:702 start_codon:yes stop_codon:yes gene_type:complete